MARLQARYHLFISCGQCRGVIWADVVVGWCVVCTDYGRPRALEAAGFEQGAEGDCPPTMRQRMPERLMRCVTGVLFAASTIPEPVASARGSACGGDACGRRTVPCRCRPVGAAVSRRWRSARITCRCRGGRDKILSRNGRLSRKPVFAAASRPHNRVKSMTWMRHTRTAPTVSVRSCGEVLLFSSV